MTEYTLTLDDGSKAVTLSSVQKDKSMQVRTYKGTTYDAMQAGLTRGNRKATIDVTAGDTLLIVVGDQAWNSYQTIKKTVYTLTIAAAPQGWDGKTAMQPTKGDGSTEDPYQITSAAELAWLRNNINTRVASQGGHGSITEKEAYGSAVLMNDIDLNDQAWVPISVVTSNGAEKGYTGTFNGNGHTIFGLNAIVDPNTTDAVGAALFGHVYGGTIKNLTVKGISNGKNYTAGIAAILFNGTISDCTSDVTVNGARMIGGITGYMSNADCKLIRCANTGNITGNDTGAVGGVCGTANKGEINACYNSGTVTCTGNRRQTGGIAASGAAKITDCYNTGNVVTNTTKSKQVGGIVGYYSGTSLSNCYNTGAITASSNVGAILGGGGSGIENCYYDNTGKDANEATTALPAADINTARFATKLGAAFGSLGSGAPVLMWQTGAKAVAAFDVTPEDAEVTLTPAAQTAAGEKNVFLLTSGTSYTYTVSASGRADASGALETGSKLYTIELPAAQAYRVWFNVMDKESGEKITGYTVEVKSGDTVCPAGEDGKYSLYAGKYTYTVSASGYETAKGEFTVTKTNRGVDVSMARPGAWDGTTTEQPEQVNGVYQIANAKQLAWFAQKINAGGSRSLCAVLISDIVINDASTSNKWTPIQDGISGYGTAEEDRCEYTGMFDGKGHTVYGLTAPLFGNADKGSMIKNVTVTGTITGSTNVGAICKTTYGNIESCVSYATITVDGKRTGGIAGLVYAGGSITNCINYGAITSTYATPSLAPDAKEAYIGGIVGYAYVGVETCANFGEVKATGDGISCVGGIAGYARVGYEAEAGSAYLLNCYNTGAVSAASKTGGIVGEAAVAVTNCYNTGAVTGGAIIGSSATGSSMTNCHYLTGSCTDGGSAAEKTEAEMKSAAFVLTLGKAYGQDTTPNQNKGYPIFTWQGGTKPTIDPDEEAVAKDAAALTVPETVTEAGDLHLTTTGDNSSTITWSSNNKTIITDAGVVTLPAEADETVTLTATVTKSLASQTRTFRVLVKTDTGFRQAELAKIEQSLPKSLVPVYGADTNVNELLRSKLAAAIKASGAALKPEDITVRLTNGGKNNMDQTDPTAYLDASEENNGKITYYYNDPKTDSNHCAPMVGVTFQLSSGAASVEHAMQVVRIHWDVDKVKAAMQA
ncbi:MAG: immunoglobulin-like domain-containing protein [Oscillospiraceae bacterium]